MDSVPLTDLNLNTMIKKFINWLSGNSGESERISFKETFDLTDLPIVTFYQGNNKLHFLLDTGSTDCIIDSNLLDWIKHSPAEEKSSLHGMDGINRIVGSCIITISYKDREFSHPFLMSDMKAAFNTIKEKTGVTLHGIIGSNFFNKYKYVLDFNEMVAYSKQ